MSDPLVVVPWCTTDDVQTITQVTVTDVQLAQAIGVIELFAGRTINAPRLAQSTLGWLKRAVAYQAAWMSAQPDLFTRSDIDSVSQDGLVASYKGEGALLAPLARRALKRLRWKGSHSVSMESDFDRAMHSTGVYPFPASGGVVGVYDYPGENWRSE